MVVRTAEIILLGWGLTVAVCDMWQRRLPNPLTLGMLAAGVAFLGISGVTPLGNVPAQAWLAFGLALLLTLPAYVLRLLGAGDVKLAAAIGILTGLPQFLAVYGIAAMLSLGMALAARFASGLPYGHLPGFLMGSGVVKGHVGQRRYIPFGAALGLALAVVVVGRYWGW